MKWEPLITGEKLAKKTLEALEVIKNKTVLYFSENPSLLGSNAGVSIFWEYLYLNERNISLRIKSTSIINNCLHVMSSSQLPYNLSTGVSGILWAYCHLVNTDAINTDLNNFIAHDVDEFLLKHSVFDLQRSNYDYLHGGLSALPYFLERPNNKLSRKCICEIIDELDKTAESFPVGITWMEGFHYLSDNVKRYNLGMAHGMPSLVVLLSKIIEKGIETEKSSRLLHGLVEWIIAQKDPNGMNGLFPLTMPSTPPFNNRISWCYGDLGITLAIYQAGVATNNKGWIEEAISIGKSILKRADPKLGIIDTCFCHGTIGNAHLFNRLYQYTRIDEFKGAALYWYGATLDFYEMNGHFKFFTRDMDGSNPRWEEEVGILEGIAGTGLAFLAAISDIEPKWDRCLLLS